MEQTTEAVMRILREPEVYRRTGISRVTRWRWERDGMFPRRVRLGRNIVGWREHEIQEWIESRPRGFAA
jgi:prophage regulatory protein